MSLTTEINPEQNEVTRSLRRLLQQFRDESRAVTVASIALFVAAIAALVAVFAYNDAKEARLGVEVELRATREEMTRLKEELELLQLIEMRGEVDE